VYTCSIVDCSSWFFVHLEIYMHRSVNIFPWYPRSLPTIFLIHLVFNGVGKNLIYECFFIIFASSRTHISWIVFGLNLNLISVSTPFVFSHAHVFLMIWREWGFHVCAYCIQMQKNQICAWTLGSFLISFKALFDSYHHIFLCPIGSLGLLIACLLH
jgi:uncharacterized Zn-finger protein